ncbi:hypothetical protein KS18_15495 [Photorhabdus luminescens]|nr:hypothetical protein KS18_15495 [Photorhabdus luminescens]
MGRAAGELPGDAGVKAGSPAPRIGIGMQTAGTQPDTVSVPAQHLETGAGLVTEDKSGFVLPA